MMTKLLLMTAIAVACCTQAFVIIPRTKKASSMSISSEEKAAAVSTKGGLVGLRDMLVKTGLLATLLTPIGASLPIGGNNPLIRSAEAAVVNLPRCEGGQGPGCEAMSEGSEFVRKLQERSAKNYDESMRKKVIAYNYNNFKDYFSFKGQVLVIRPDGRFIAINKKVYDQLSKEGKVDGNKWLSDEDPPEGATDFIPGTLDKLASGF